MDRFCYQCRKDSEARPCWIIGFAMAYGVEDPEYPKEWIYGGDGWPLCTAYRGRDEGGPRVRHPKPCPLTDDLFGPNPVKIGVVDGIRDKALADATKTPAKTRETA